MFTRLLGFVARHILLEFEIHSNNLPWSLFVFLGGMNARLVALVGLSQSCQATYDSNRQSVFFFDFGRPEKRQEQMR